MKLLADATRAFVGASLDPEALLPTIAEQIMRAIGDSCAVSLLSEDGAELHYAAIRDRDPEREAVTRELVRLYPHRATEGTSAEVLRTGQSILLTEHDLTSPRPLLRPEWREIQLRYPMFGQIIAPLPVQGRPAGCLSVARYAPRPFQEEDLTLLEALADRAGMAIEHAQVLRAREEARRAAEANAARIACLQSVTAALAGAITPEDVAAVALKHGSAVLGGVAGTIAFLDDTGEPIVFAMQGYPEDTTKRVIGLRNLPHNPLVDVVQTGAPLFIEDEKTFLARYPHWADEAQKHGHRALVVVLLRTPRGILGTIEIRFAQDRRFEPAEREMIELLADQCAQALERARLHDRDCREARRLQHLIAQTPAIINILRGPDLVFELAHPYTVRALGGRELAGKPVLEAIPEHKDQPFVGYLQHVYRTGERFEGKQARAQFDRTGTGKLEESYWDFVYQPTRDESGRIDGVMTMDVEVTDQVFAFRAAEAARARLEAAEERLRLALEAGAIGIWDVDLATGRVEADARCRAIMGLPADGELDRESFFRSVHNDDKENALAVARRALEPTSSGTFATEFRMREADGSMRWVGQRGRATFDAEGRPTRFMGGVADITGRMRAEEERALLLERAELARMEAEQASRAKDEFMAMLGHELRNPLSPMLTALQLMQMRAPDVLVKERSIIERQVMHLARLVDDLLDVSRIARGKIELRRKKIELANVLGRAMELARPLLEGRRHHVSVSAPASGLPTYGDEQRLVQVFANLLTNAAKYTEPGGSIGISAERQDGEVVVRVRDSGMGIGPELLPHVFDLFIQGKRTIDRTEGGLGLGLSIVQSLVKLHGGTIHAESEGSGKGSTFTVRLPLDTSEEAGQDTRARESVGFPGAAALKRRLILVVDDNRDAAETLAEGLRVFGYEVLVAHEGPSGLAVAAEARPDLALLDIGLPVMDGYELARRLHGIPGMASLPLVALTGYGQLGDRIRSMEAGFRAHLVKPVELSQVVSLLSSLGVPPEEPPRP